MSVKQELEKFNIKYPLQTQEVNGEDFTFRYHENGDTTLVLLTGGIGKSDLFYSHFEAFSKYYSVVTFDYHNEFSINNELADAIVILLKQIGVSNVYLVGQSYGGLLAQVIVKRHPKMIQGLVLSNTGSLSKDMNQEGRDCMLNMVNSMKKTVNLLKFLPMGLLKPVMRKNIAKKVATGSEKEKEYMNGITECMLSLLTKKHEVYMCNLMGDLTNNWDMTSEDFQSLKGRVLLILSEDDITFNDGVKESLIDIMPDPTVHTDISGGHLALFLKIEDYVEIVEDFMGN